MNSENSKFYILIVCSLVIFITSLFSISDSSSITSSVLGIVLLIIPIRKSNDNRISKVCNNFNINFELNGNSNENLISNFHSLPNSPDANCSSNQLFKAERHRGFLL